MYVLRLCFGANICRNYDTIERHRRRMMTPTTNPMNNTYYYYYLMIPSTSTLHLIRTGESPTYSISFTRSYYSTHPLYHSSKILIEVFCTIYASSARSLQNAKKGFQTA